MIIAHFLSAHWLDLILGTAFFFLITAKVIPPRFAGLDEKYFDLQRQEMVDQSKQSLLEAVMTALAFTLTKALFVTIGLRGFITLVLFVLIGASLIFGKDIATNIVIISVIGILALYAEQLIERAASFSIAGIFRYQSGSNGGQPSANQPPSQTSSSNSDTSRV
ncbi:MAG TPA: hypothetical protein VHC21_04615 [Candidatus Saccharimonadales bacterium]|nr:hypothetical protein [Candidatus Saccharimonadales bacterium]